MPLSRGPSSTSPRYAVEPGPIVFLLTLVSKKISTIDKCDGSRLECIPGRREGDPGSKAYRDDVRGIPDLETHSKWFEH